MTHRYRRALALLVPALLLALAACGGDSSDTAKSFDAVTISGAEGAAPQVKWKATMEPGKEEAKTLVKGTGPALKNGDRVLVNFLLSNGYTHQTPLDTYGAKKAGATLTVGAPAAQPQVPADLLTGILSKKVKPGMTVGTRLAITVGAEQAFGQYANKLGQFKIGNKDGLLLVADLVGTAAKKPAGKKVKPPAWAPTVVEKRGVPTALTFGALPKPSPKDDLRVATLVQGKGPKVKAGDVVVANYLGQVHGGDKPFDGSYSRGEPLSVAIGDKVDGGAITVVKGWSEGLEGVAVGSRVIVQIPPRLGYGKAGGGNGAITGTDTMYFVIDVLGAA